MTSAHGTPAHDPGQPLAVGDLARATGLTVRTLHHYDRLGLLSPGRDAAGRRRYGPAETRRLHQIIALRGFVELIERMITVDRKLSPEQLAELYQQRQQLLPADFPGPGPARNDHRRNAGRAARHKVRHEARGSVEHP